MVAVKIKAVLDTNVFISGLINPKGPPGEILKALKAGSFILVTSADINQEIFEVLNRPKIRDKYGLAEHLFDITIILWEIAEITFQLPEVKVSQDADDNKFLSAAVGGNADYLVTGDLKDLLHIKKYEDVRIIKPEEFLPLLK